MGLDAIIPAEIKDDAFAAALRRIAADPRVRTIVEIGASSGDGSTAALHDGAVRNPSRPPDLYCIEASRERHARLAARYAAVPFVHPLCMSTVSPDELPSPTEVGAFYDGVPGNGLRRYPRADVLSWLEEDRRYLRSGVPAGAIERAREMAGVAVFGAALVDGSEFSGLAELPRVHGALFLMLDDVATFKNHGNRLSLLADPSYDLVEEDLSLRNGFSVFERRVP